jgi:hypothetical protein
MALYKDAWGSHHLLRLAGSSLSLFSEDLFGEEFSLAEEQFRRTSNHWLPKKSKMASLFIPPIEFVDARGNEFVKVSQGASVPLSSLPLSQRRSFVDQNVGTVPSLCPAMTAALMQIRRRQLRGEKDSNEDNEDNASTSYLSSGTLSTLRTSMSMMKSDVGGKDGQLSAERVEQQLAVEKAIMNISAALYEIDSLSNADAAAHDSNSNSTSNANNKNNNAAVKSGFFDLLKRRNGSQLSLLPISDPKMSNRMKGSFVSSSTSSTSSSNTTTMESSREEQVLNSSFRLKRKRQQLTSASSILKSAHDRLSRSVAAHQKTSEQLLVMKKAWRIIVKNFNGGRLINNNDTFAVDCGLGESEKPSINPLSSVELSIHPLSGNINMVPHLKVYELELTLIGPGGLAVTKPIKLQDVLKPSLRWHGRNKTTALKDNKTNDRMQDDAIEEQEQEEDRRSLDGNFDKTNRISILGGHNHNDNHNNDDDNGSTMVDMFDDMGEIQDGVLAHEIFRMLQHEACGITRWMPRIVAPHSGATPSIKFVDGVAASSSSSNSGSSGSGSGSVKVAEGHPQPLDLCLLSMTRSELTIEVNNMFSIKIELKLTDKCKLLKKGRRGSTATSHDNNIDVDSKERDDEVEVYSHIISELMLNCVLEFQAKLRLKQELDKLQQTTTRKAKLNELPKVI